MVASWTLARSFILLFLYNYYSCHPQDCGAALAQHRTASAEQTAALATTVAAVACPPTPAPPAAAPALWPVERLGLLAAIVNVVVAPTRASLLTPRRP